MTPEGEEEQERATTATDAPLTEPLSTAASSPTTRGPATPIPEPVEVESGDGTSESVTTEMAAPTEPVVEESAVPDGKKRKKKRSTLARVTELPMLVLLAFGIAILIKTFLVQAFFIPSTSMLPTLHRGDRVLVEKVGYLIGDPGRGDVVVFAKSVFGAGTVDVPWHQDVRNFFRELLGLPTGREEDYIKRIVAVEGDVISYTGSPRKLIVNGAEEDQSYIRGGKDQGSPTLTSSDCKRLNMEVEGNGCRVPAGKVFVMGDNRGNSEDSRILGPIDEDKIVGRAFVIIWPPGDFGGL